MGHPLDEKVKKCSSQSLIKLQAAQATGAKELQNGPSERKATVCGVKATKVPSLGKKSQLEAQIGGKMLESGNITKKLIFSFKKNEKQIVTPPNAATTQVPKTSHIGLHRRV